MEFAMTFPSYSEWNVIIQLTFTPFFRGVGQPPTRRDGGTVTIDCGAALSIHGDFETPKLEFQRLQVRLWGKCTTKHGKNMEKHIEIGEVEVNDDFVRRGLKMKQFFCVSYSK